MTQNSILDKLEEGLVFRISRSFFVILVLIAMLGIVAGAAYFVWGNTPTSKEAVARQPDPKPVMLSAADIKERINRPKTKVSDRTETPSSTRTEEKSEDPNQIRFQALLDTLRTLLPSSLYSWQSSGYWTYPNGREMYSYFQREEYRKWNVTESGISDKLKQFYSEVSDYEEAIRPLEQLCDVLREFPEDQRLAPFNAFLELFHERQAEYKELIKEIEDTYQSEKAAAENKYDTTLANKAIAKYQGLIAIGSAIASVAFLAIFLVLLSMQRNLKRIALQNQGS